jgi:hypothetical protein
MVFNETARAVFLCKNAPGRPMKEESDNQRVDSIADRPARLVKDRSEGESPDAGTITVEHPETGQYDPADLNPTTIPEFE